MQYSNYNIYEHNENLIYKLNIMCVCVCVCNIDMLKVLNYIFLNYSYISLYYSRL